MADESNRDELLRGRFKKLRERVLEKLQSTTVAARAEARIPPTVDGSKVDSAKPEKVPPEQPQFEELTQERMDAMRDFAWTGKARLEYQAFERQKVNDIERHKQAQIRQAVKKGYALRKAEIADDNRTDADAGLAKRMSPDEIDNRPGEKFILRRTKGMAREKDPNDTAGPSP